MRGIFLWAVVMAALLATPWLSVAPPASAANVTFVVEERNVLMNPALLTVTRGDSVTIVVYNNDSFEHTFTIFEFDVNLSMPAMTVDQTTFTADTAGTFWYVCLVPGHATSHADGTWTEMAGRLVVNEPPAPPTPYLETVLVVGAIVGLAASLRFRARRQR